jgi:Tfp pilus assembly protein PilE
MRSSPPLRNGASLIELLVVFAIIGIMMSMLMPALHSARERANETVCMNNVYQLNAAMHHFRSTHKRLPPPNSWTFDLLPYLEEKALARALRASDPAAVPIAKILPAVFSCTAQSEVKSSVAGIPICHFMLVIDAPFERRSDKIPWKITDRPRDLPSGKLPPWYIGPEIHPAEFHRLVNDGQGPHRGGVFFP